MRDEDAAVSSEGPADIVGGLVNGISVLRAFDADHADMPLSEVARRAGLTRATARRSLLTFMHLGYVRTDGSSFALTPRVLELGYGFLSGLSLPELAQPHLERLSRETGESSSASILDDTDIVYVARVPVRRIMSVGIRIGTRLPAALTSMGRALLADASASVVDAAVAAAIAARPEHDEGWVRARIDAARADGFALVDQELEVGLRSLAVPVRGRDGHVVAAINLATAAVGEPELLVERHLDALREASAAIEGELRHASPAR